MYILRYLPTYLLYSSDALKEAITDKMMERSRDKLPAIRCFAVACLSCFQMSHSVMEEFSRIMDSDTNRYSSRSQYSNVLTAYLGTYAKQRFLTLGYPNVSYHSNRID